MQSIVRKERNSVDMASAMALATLSLLIPKTARKKSHKYESIKLYAFPSFDKCDSLVYFPTTMARFLNSADFDGLTGLCQAHLSKSCGIQMVGLHSALNSGSFLKIFEFINDMHTDSVTCVHNTKVEGNHIKGMMYKKFTDCKLIVDSVKRNFCDREVVLLFPTGSRADHFKQKLKMDNMAESKRQRYCAMVESDEDLLVYMKIRFDITFDDVSRKIVSMAFVAEFTSVHPANDAIGGVEVD